MVTVLEARSVAMALLDARLPEATVCPSEVARALAKAADVQTQTAGWRSLMPVVHIAVDGLVQTATIQLSWKGHKLSQRAGPYRIGRIVFDDDI